MKRAHIASWLLIATLLTACAGTRSAYHEAITLDETATVVGEHYYALVKEAADLKASGALHGGALAQVQAADTEAKPLVIQLTTAAEAYRALRTADSEAVLQEALNQAVLAVNGFINALRSARGS